MSRIKMHKQLIRDLARAKALFKRDPNGAKYVQSIEFQLESVRQLYKESKR